jgi:ligand-binding sensor domain-containing protein/signal transduction histidine kinase
MATMLAIRLSLLCQPYYFRHYEVESGLSNNAVMCSVQDKLGFMWFGTRDGINRFDGYTFKVYRFGNNSNHYKSSGNNFIHALNIDASGSLLLATEKEIYRYDAQIDSFIFLVSSHNYPIDEIISDRKGNIWFNAGNILYRYSESSRQLKIYEPQKFFGATAVTMDRDGILWVSTADGFLKKYNEADDTFSSFDLFAHSDQSLPRNSSIIQCTEDGKILVGTNKAGFKIFDTKTSSYTDVPLCCEKLNNLFIRSFLQVSSTETWIGTETGIFIYDAQMGMSQKIEKNSSDQHAISDNVIYTLCKDKEGGIWVGTYFGGINYYPKQFTPFQKFYHKPFENSLSGNIVREIRKDQFGNLWIGTEDGGLNKLDAKTKKFTHYKPDNTPQSISYICVHDLLPLETELWVGTYEQGLDILNIKSGKVVRHYNASPENGLKSDFPFCLLKTEEGEIIVGTTTGIYSYKRDKDYFEPLPNFPPYDWYLCILKDAQGTFWTGISGKGIYYVHIKTGASGNFRFDPSDPTSISSDKVNSIFEDSKKNLWFATENGLCKWNPAKRNFKRYGTNNGFPSNFMLAMLEDEKGQLWISTTKGLTCFDPQKDKALVYTTANGLLSDQFNFSSAFKDKDGRMYFGSAKGLISFHPSEFSQDSFIPPVYLTGLQVNNQDIAIAPKGSPLKRSIIYTDKIILNYNQSTFSLDFAALGYTAPQNLEYAYQLEGLFNNWTYVKGIRKANFTKLEPGTYVFKVKASSSSGIWSDEETKMIIEILPPWWASRWAYTAYAILATLLIYYFFHNYHKRIEEKNRRKIELLEIAKEKEIMQLEIAKEKEILQLEIAKEKEMLESKIEFFTNVAHEIRTPLTLIKVPLATVIEKTTKTPIVENCLKIMERNTNRLIELSNQLLDFRQTEIKGYSLKLEKVNISELLSDTHGNFTKLAEQNNINVTTALPPTPLFAFVDLDAFNKIIYNLFSNAVKYAATTVHISLLHNCKAENSFTILVKNDGYLIPDDLKEKIFEPFYRIKETEIKKGTGIGLALARSLTLIHNGELHLEQPEDNMNVFSLTLPIYNQIENR